MGPRGGGAGRRRRRGVADAARRDAGGCGRGLPCPSASRPASRARDQSVGAACVPQDHLEPVLLASRSRAAGARVELGVELVGCPTTCPTACEVDAACGRTGRERHGPRPLPVAADGAHSRVRRTLGIPCATGLDAGEAVSAVFRRSALAAPRRAPLRDLRHNHPDARGILLPGRAHDRWLYGVVWSPGERQPPRLPTPNGHAPDPAGRRRPDLPVAIERTGALPVRHPAGRPVPGGERVPGRRRRPPGHPPRRHRHEHGDPRRLRPGLEARLGAPGWARPALLDSYELERRPVAEHNWPDRWTRRARRERRSRASRRPRRPHPARAGSDGSRAGVDPRPPRARAHRLHRPRRRSLAAPEGFAADRVPVTLRRVDPISARASGSAEARRWWSARTGCAPPRRQPARDRRLPPRKWSSGRDPAGRRRLAVALEPLGSTSSCRDGRSRRCSRRSSRARRGPAGGSRGSASRGRGRPCTARPSRAS